MQNKREVFLKTLYGEKSKYTPVWFMRQAGRFLKEYRELREKYDFLTMCREPELAARITLLPEKLDVDALILFSDILIPLLSFRAQLNYKDNSQPTVKIELKNLESSPDFSRISFVLEAIKLVKSEDREHALIGFAASPFTLSCYIFGGDGFSNLKAFMKNREKEYFELLENLTDMTIEYLKLKLKAGCDAVQLFDSWAGILSKDDYKKFVLPFVKRIAENVKPSIYFVKNSCHLNEFLEKLDFNCFSVDWRTSLKDIYKKTMKTVQGNMDNTVPLLEKRVIEKETVKILSETENIPHIFNLGHGVLKNTEPDSLKFIVDLVHERTLK